jgi:hypothetical protein
VYCLHGKTIADNLRKIKPEGLVVPYPLSSFRPPFNEAFEFYLNEAGDTTDDRVSLVFAGPPATGKTVRALAEFGRPFLVTGCQMELLHKVVTNGTPLKIPVILTPTPAVYPTSLTSSHASSTSPHDHP